MEFTIYTSRDHIDENYLIREPFFITELQAGCGLKIKSPYSNSFEWEIERDLIVYHTTSKLRKWVHSEENKCYYEEIESLRLIIETIYDQSYKLAFYYPINAIYNLISLKKNRENRSYMMKSAMAEAKYVSKPITRIQYVFEKIIKKSKEYSLNKLEHDDIVKEIFYLIDNKNKDVYSFEGILHVINYIISSQPFNNERISNMLENIKKITTHVELLSSKETFQFIVKIESNYTIEDVQNWLLNSHGKHLMTIIELMSSLSESFFYSPKEHEKNKILILLNENINIIHIFSTYKDRLSNIVEFFLTPECYKKNYDSLSLFFIYETGLTRSFFSNVIKNMNSQALLWWNASGNLFAKLFRNTSFIFNLSTSDIYNIIEYQLDSYYNSVVFNAKKYKRDFNQVSNDIEIFLDKYKTIISYLPEDDYLKKKVINKYKEIVQNYKSI